jgi:hypothetical protein
MPDFSSRVNWKRNDFALANASSQPVPVAFAEQEAVSGTSYDSQFGKHT